MVNILDAIMDEARRSRAESIILDRMDEAVRPSP